MEQTRDAQRIQDGARRLREKDRSLAPILGAFEPLLMELARARARLLDQGADPAPMDREKLGRGVPLFVDAPLGGHAGAFVSAARTVLPVTGRAFVRIADDLRKILYALENETLDPAALMEAAMSGDAQALKKLARATDAGRAALELAVALAMRPVLQTAGRDIVENLDLGSWGRGYCPLCGAAPGLAILRKSGEDDPYLKSHGGQRWLVCSRCSSQWRFKRHACPHCGNEEHDTLEYFHLEGQRHKRADLCRACGRYLATYDAAQAEEDPVPEVTALGLLPLDILMQRDGFQPVAQTLWNRVD
ncbi:formate dehydrogenase accessory protein FdhE [Desulfocurvus sp. DL9XJH121]